MIRILLAFVFTFLSFNDICSMESFCEVNFFKLNKIKDCDYFDTGNGVDVNDMKVNLTMNDLNGGALSFLKRKILAKFPDKLVKIYAVGGCNAEGYNDGIYEHVDGATQSRYKVEITDKSDAQVKKLISNTIAKNHPLVVYFNLSDNPTTPHKGNNSSEKGTSKKCCCR